MTIPSTREARIERLCRSAFNREGSPREYEHAKMLREAAAELTASLDDGRRIEELEREVKTATIRAEAWSRLCDKYDDKLQAAEARLAEVEKERDEALRFASCSSLSQLASCYVTAQVNWDLTLGRAERAEAEVARLSAAPKAPETQADLVGVLAEAGQRWIKARRTVLTVSDQLRSEDFKAAWRELGDAEWGLVAALAAFDAASLGVKSRP